MIISRTVVAKTRKKKSSYKRACEWDRYHPAQLVYSWACLGFKTTAQHISIGAHWGQCAMRTANPTIKLPPLHLKRTLPHASNLHYFFLSCSKLSSAPRVRFLDREKPWRTATSSTTSPLVAAAARLVSLFPAPIRGSWNFWGFVRRLGFFLLNFFKCDMNESSLIWECSWFQFIWVGWISCRNEGFWGFR